MEINNRLTRGEELLRVTTPSRNSSRRIKLDYPQKNLEDYLFRYIEEVVKERKGDTFYNVAHGNETTIIKDEENVRNAVSIISELLTTDNGKTGFMLLGNVGVGKTTILRALQQVFLGLARFNYISDDLYVRYTPATDIDNRDDYKMTFNALCNENVLAIDDLGAEGAEQLDFGTVKTPVINLIEYRYTRRLFTCFSTNLTLKEIQAKYGDRVYDRLNEMCEYIGFAGESYR